MCHVGDKELEKSFERRNNEAAIHLIHNNLNIYKMYICFMGFF